MTAWVRDEILQAAASVHAVRHRGAVARDGRRRTCRATACWRWRPGPGTTALDDVEAEAEIGWVIDLVTAIRSVRAEMNISHVEMPLVLVGVSAATRGAGRAVGRHHPAAGAAFGHFARGARVPQGAVQLIVRGEVAALPLTGVIDFAAEKARLEKEMARVDADIARIDAKLANADFVARAPEEVVEGEREKREEAESRRPKIIEALERLKGAA